MQNYVAELRMAVEQATPLLLKLSPAEARQSTPGKWSPCQIIGHLIDSAANNHRRFVLGQLQEDLHFPGYAQEDWVRVQRYDEASWEELVTLWKYYNLHLARVMETAPEETLTKLRTRHNLHEIAWKAVPVEEPTTLGYFMNDYVGHLKNHLRQILGPDWET
ncbi:MAG: DinB family protein [Blastocatellia bacterium]|nr:DinB family protein [Blastocatellia bacterium]